MDELTAREIDVVRLLVRGFGDKEIAAQLRISVATIRGHMGVVKLKLRAHSGAEVAAIAVRNRIVELPVDDDA